jgi:uncharacterized XkdX family phage protein
LERKRKMYRKVKRLYDLGLYTAEQVKDFADRGKITPEQYEEITGEKYESEDNEGGGKIK